MTYLDWKKRQVRTMRALSLVFMLIGVLSLFGGGWWGIVIGMLCLVGGLLIYSGE